MSLGTNGGKKPSALRLSDDGAFPGLDDLPDDRLDVDDGDWVDLDRETDLVASLPAADQRERHTGRPRRRRRLLLSAVVMTVLAGAVWFGARSLSGGPGYSIDFSGRDGLVTNEYAYWNNRDPDRVVSDGLILTSGSLFRRAGRGWSGKVDRTPPDVLSVRTTDSAAFKMFTRSKAFGDARVGFRFRVISLGTDESANDWDGLHVLLRADLVDRFYAVSVFRSDGAVVIKRRSDVASDDAAAYRTLATEKAALSKGEWHRAEIITRNVDDGVTIEVRLDGKVAVAAFDVGQGGRPALVGQGQVGLRGDNTEFEIDDFSVDSL